MEQTKSSREPLPASQAQKVPHLPKPSWVKVPLANGEGFKAMKDLLRGDNRLHTVCEEAKCPNIGECWNSGTATIMLGSDTCTRGCRFCAVKTSRRPPPLNPKEPEDVASKLSHLNLRYVVLTSVDRDDLEDGGAGHFAATIRACKAKVPHMKVEALVSDFRGSQESIQTVLNSGLDVYAHNLETVRDLTPRVRDPRAGYEQSLQVLQNAKRLSSQPIVTKSSLMLGLGETDDEIDQALQDLRAHQVDVVTFGQYLRPTLSHLPVERYVKPEAFQTWVQRAYDLGFLYSVGGPFVRSSYKAAELFLAGHLAKM
jgi:lipoyl synthase